MKERRIRCKQCGERFTVLRVERERTSAYCEQCRTERKREQTRERMREQTRERMREQTRERMREQTRERMRAWRERRRWS